MTDEQQAEGADGEGSPSLDMNPEQAAETALSDADAPAPADMGSMGGGTPFWKRTEPNPDIENVEPVEQWQEYWAEYLVRGSQKAAGADDAWAMFDFIRGIVGGSMKLMEEYDL